MKTLAAKVAYYSQQTKAKPNQPASMVQEVEKGATGSTLYRSAQCHGRKAAVWLCTRKPVAEQESSANPSGQISAYIIYTDIVTTVKKQHNHI